MNTVVVILDSTKEIIFRRIGTVLAYGNSYFINFEDENGKPLTISYPKNLVTVYQEYSK